MRVAITGATGFVGGALVSHLAEKAGCEVAALTRGAWHHPSRRVRSVAVGDLSDAAWPAGVFADADAVVHTAAITSCWARYHATSSQPARGSIGRRRYQHTTPSRGD
jgi:uncharacterized protein YbjT (DUF2867 family)